MKEGGCKKKKTGHISSLKITMLRHNTRVLVRRMTVRGLI